MSGVDARQKLQEKLKKRELAAEKRAAASAEKAAAAAAVATVEDDDQSIESSSSAAAAAAPATPAVKIVADNGDEETVSIWNGPNGAYIKLGALFSVVPLMFSLPYTIEYVVDYTRDYSELCGVRVLGAASLWCCAAQPVRTPCTAVCLRCR